MNESNHLAPGNIGNTPQVPSLSPAKSTKNVLLLSLLALALMIAAGIGSYSWEHTKLKTATKDLANANAEIKKQAKTIQSLNAKADKLQPAAKSNTGSPTKITTVPTQSDLGLTVNASKYMNPDGTVTAGSSWFGIRMTLTNPTSESVNIAVNKFQLRDSNDNFYQLQGETNASTFPEGWGSSTLQDRAISPNESIKAVILFPMPNEKITNFTLLNDTREYPVTAN